MKDTIFLFSSGTLKRKDNTIFFEKEKTLDVKEKPKFIPVENVKEILIFGEVNFNKKLLEYLTQKQITMHYFNYYGYYMGSFYPREHYNCGHIILNQALIYSKNKKRLFIAKKFIFGAVKNILKVIEYYNKRNRADLSLYINNISLLMKLIKACDNIESLMSVEARIREIYYQCWDLIIQKEDFKFELRTKRPPKNYLNTLISFGNSMMYVTVLSEIYKTHLDPRIGFLHATNFRKFSLNLDIAEIFKPVIVDRVIFSALNKNEIQPKHFSLNDNDNGLLLNEEGKKIFLKHYEEQLKTTIKYPALKRKVSYLSLIRMECYKLEKHLIGDKKYKPYISHW